MNVLRKAMPKTPSTQHPDYKDGNAKWKEHADKQEEEEAEAERDRLQNEFEDESEDEQENAENDGAFSDVGEEEVYEEEEEEAAAAAAGGAAEGGLDDSAATAAGGEGEESSEDEVLEDSEESLQMGDLVFLSAQVGGTGQALCTIPYCHAALYQSIFEAEPFNRVRAGTVTITLNVS
jgi:hypothetical protein